MQLRTLTTCALATFAAVSVAACGAGTPAPDSTIGAAPPATDSVTPAPAASASSPPPATPSAAGSSAAAPRVAESPRSDRPALATAPDTVRGIVSEVGSLPMTSVVVQPASGGAVTITGPLAREVARAAGADVWISGVRDGRSISARAYAVRMVDGEAATDGVIARDGDRLVLVTAAGRRPIARPLQALRGMIGARVWLVGPLDGTITSYGILREP